MNHFNGPTGTLNSFPTSPPCVSGDKSFDINTNISDQEIPQKTFFIVWCKPAWTSLCQWIGVDVQSQVQASLRKPTWRRPCCYGPLVIWRLILRLLFGSYNLSLKVTIFSAFHRIGPLGPFDLVVAKSVCLSVCLSVCPFSCDIFWGLLCPHFPKSDV